MISAPHAVDTEATGTPLWLITFADLTALLVALFVLIFSMSTPVSLVATGTGIGSGGTVLSERVLQDNARAGSAGRSAMAGELTLGYLAAVLSERGLASNDLADPVAQVMEPMRLILRLREDFMFDGDGRTLSPLGAGHTEDLAQVLRTVTNPVSIVVPVIGGDWGLAFDRADLVDKQFQRAGYERPVERFVVPGLEQASGNEAILLVIARHEGGRR